jgi:hypothetical protein
MALNPTGCLAIHGGRRSGRWRGRFDARPQVRAHELPRQPPTPHPPERDELATVEQRLDPAAAADLGAAVTPHRRASASRMRADSPGAATPLIPRSSARTRCSRGMFGGRRTGRRSGHSKSNRCLISNQLSHCTAPALRATGSRRRVSFRPECSFARGPTPEAGSAAYWLRVTRRVASGRRETAERTSGSGWLAADSRA